MTMLYVLVVSVYVALSIIAGILIAGKVYAYDAKVFSKKHSKIYILFPMALILVYPWYYGLEGFEKFMDWLAD